MQSKLTQNFEKKVLFGLKYCGIDTESISDNSPLGIAVSGGADSVSLLLSLSSLFSSRILRVITVDHGIRPNEESGGDALFVENLCRSMSISCKVVKIPHGKIAKNAGESSDSLEAVARDFRYEAFFSFIKEENLCALCLAHNQNDQTETLLMRFLQGSGGEGMGGISRIRGKIIRPLLEITRKEIEAYLTERNQSWRTDSTNSDTKYLRNKIRNILVPMLNENFSGWQKALLSGVKKSMADEDFFKSSLLELECGADSSKISRQYFFSLHDALKRRLFYSLLNKKGFSSRFPFRLFEEICSWKDEKNRELTFENLKISLDSENLLFSFFTPEPFIESSFAFFLTDIGDIIENNDFIISVECLPQSEKACGQKKALLTFSPSKSGMEKVSLQVFLPLCVRSALPGDEILAGNGKRKSVSQIFSDWKIPKKLRERVLLLEEVSSGRENSLRALLASHLAFKNWIVEEAKL